MESELTEEEVIQHAMVASEAEERAKWIGLEEVIQRSQQEAAPALSPPPPTVEQLPPPPPLANM
jgi:hypothetical protein